MEIVCVCDPDENVIARALGAVNKKQTRTPAVKKDLRFMWLADPNGELWKTFDAKAMPTNILIDKGGKVVKVVPGCTKDGKNAQLLSGEIARLLQTAEAPVTESKPKK